MKHSLKIILLLIITVANFALYNDSTLATDVKLNVHTFDDKPIDHEAALKIAHAILAAEVSERSQSERGITGKERLFGKFTGFHSEGSTRGAHFFAQGEEQFNKILSAILETPTKFYTASDEKGTRLIFVKQFNTEEIHEITGKEIPYIANFRAADDRRFPKSNTNYAIACFEIGNINTSDDLKHTDGGYASTLTPVSETNISVTNCSLLG